ncbi:MAG: hypothetical protein HY360_11270 [Verrucomicrobia bacterium]|nr:hypothetical protein [Verrucomicrobiota bacterium]
MKAAQQERRRLRFIPTWGESQLEVNPIIITISLKNGGLAVSMAGMLWKIEREKGAL